MKKLLPFIILLSACGHVRYTQTGNDYNAVPNETVMVYMDGRALPENAEQIGLITYKAKNKENAIQNIQSLAAKHGATAVYIPHPKGKVRTGIPREGTFIAVRGEKVTSQATEPTPEPVVSEDENLYEVGEKIHYLVTPNNKKPATVLQKISNKEYLIEIHEGKNGTKKKVPLRKIEKI